jgi:hypothetical protein
MTLLLMEEHKTISFPDKLKKQQREEGTLKSFKPGSSSKKGEVVEIL